MDYPLANAHVLVTGGAGCLGSTIADRLMDLGARVDTLDDYSEGYKENLELARRRRHFGQELHGDLANSRAIREIIQDYDYVIHCGGHLLLKAQADGHAAIDANIHGTLNVLEASQAAGVRKVVFTSSISIFGEPSYTPVDEEHPLNNTTIYGATKIAGEHFCREFGRRGLPYSIIRPYNIYGPRQSPKNGAFSQVVPRWIRCIQRGEPIVIHGDGSQTMDLVHVHDMAEAHLQALTRKAADGEAFNIGTGIPTSAAALAYRLREAMGAPEHPVRFVLQDVNRVKARCGNIEKAHHLLGYTPSYDVESGLANTIAWWNEREGRR